MTQRVCKTEDCSNPAGPGLVYCASCCTDTPVEAPDFDAFLANPYGVPVDVEPTEDQEKSARNLRGYYLALVRAGFSETQAENACNVVIASSIQGAIDAAEKRRKR